MWHGLISLIREVIFTQVKQEITQDNIGLKVNFYMIRAKYMEALEVLCTIWKENISTESSAEDFNLGYSGRVESLR